jgi:hypothetical protein
VDKRKKTDVLRNLLLENLFGLQKNNKIENKCCLDVVGFDEHDSELFDFYLAKKFGNFRARFFQRRKTGEVQVRGFGVPVKFNHGVILPENVGQMGCGTFAEDIKLNFLRQAAFSPKLEKSGLKRKAVELRERVKKKSFFQGYFLRKIDFATYFLARQIFPKYQEHQHFLLGR